MSIVMAWRLVIPFVFLKSNHVPLFIQINTLVQLENVASYPFLAELLQEGTVKLHAFWFDVQNGEVHYFSKKSQQFDIINDQNASTYIDELESPQVLQQAIRESKPCQH